MIQTLQSLPKDLRFQVGFSRMSDGNMSYPLAKNDALVYANRKRFFTNQGLDPDRLVTFFTEHKVDITWLNAFPENLDAMKGQPLQTTDAVFSRIPNAGIFLTFADCVPFIVYDQKQHLMAFAHIGWRSMAREFTRKVLETLQEKEGSEACDLIVCIGPSIKKESYLFDNPIQAEDPIWKPYLHPQTNGKIGIDLPGFCVSQCLEFGLNESQIYMEPMDTAKDENQFSHYMGTEGGRPEKQGRLLCYGFLK